MSGLGEPGKRTRPGEQRRPGARSEAVAVPPGWPAAVPPPETPQWQRAAVAWLLDLCPADFRAYPVLARHPQALARLTALHVEAAAEACRRGLATARAELGATLPPPALAQVIEALEAEQARLIAAGRGVVLVEQALLGRRYIPRL